jgi:hypothetical protein
MYSIRILHLLFLCTSAIIVDYLFLSVPPAVLYIQRVATLYATHHIYTYSVVPWDFSVSPCCIAEVSIRISSSITCSCIWVRVPLTYSLRRMAAGSRRKYALDLNEIIAFPDAAHMPVFPPHEGESWILLLEVCNHLPNMLRAVQLIVCSLIDNRKRITLSARLCSERQNGNTLRRGIVHTQPAGGREAIQNWTYIVYNKREASTILGWTVWIPN